MEHLRQFFSDRYVDFPDADWDLIAQRFVRHEFPKKHTILRAGQVEEFVTFIEQGIVRYYILKDYRQITFEITFEGDFFGAYDSFLSRQPSLYSVETITPVVAWRLSYDAVQQLYRETAYGNLVGRLACENLFLEKLKRELSFLTDTPEQRYLRLMTEHPQMIRLIPQQFIAAYIGVTPQALSRIRRRIF